jgi:hypothetical protein
VDLSIKSGIIKEVEINFPSGCDRLIKCVLYDGATQILPTNPDGFYAEDDRTITAKVHYDLLQQYGDLWFMCWTIGTKLNHTLSMQVEVQGPDEPDIARLIDKLVDLFDRLISFMKGWL